MLRRLAVLAVTLIGVIDYSTAFAADLPAKAPAPMMAPVAVWIPIWSGFYAGVNAGYGWASVGTADVSDSLTGAIGGGQIGYNWQTGALVLGVEGDMQASGQRRSDTAVVGGTTYTLDQKIPWFATLRGRIGYAAGPWLIYGTGGVAWANYKLSVSALGGEVSNDNTKAAWTLGGGVEWMFAPRWSGKLEYLYMDTGSTSVTLFGVPFEAHGKDNLVRVGLNYHF